MDMDYRNTSMMDWEPDPSPATKFKRKLDELYEATPVEDRPAQQIKRIKAYATRRLRTMPYRPLQEVMAVPQRAKTMVQLTNDFVRGTHRLSKLLFSRANWRQTALSLAYPFTTEGRQPRPEHYVPGAFPSPSPQRAKASNSRPPSTASRPVPPTLHHRNIQSPESESVAVAETIDHLNTPDLIPDDSTSEESDSSPEPYHTSQRNQADMVYKPTSIRFQGIVRPYREYLQAVKNGETFEDSPEPIWDETNHPSPKRVNTISPTKTYLPSPPRVQHMQTVEVAMDEDVMMADAPIQPTTYLRPALKAYALNTYHSKKNVRWGGQVPNSKCLTYPRLFMQDDIVGKHYDTYIPPRTTNAVASPADSEDSPRRLANHPAEDSPLAHANLKPREKGANTRLFGGIIDKFAALSTSGQHGKREDEKAAALSLSPSVVKNAVDEATRKRVEAARKLREERRREEAERRARLAVVKPLSDEANAKLDEVLAKPISHKINQRTSRKDLGTVLPQTSSEGRGLCNDEVVYQYVDYLTKRALEKTGHVAKTPPRFHTMTSHMYSDYKQKGDLAKVARWLNRPKVGGENLYECEYLFIPINDSLHWTLLVINGRDRVITYYDSLSGRGREYTTFALDLVKHTLGDAFSASEWSTTITHSSRQTNGLDCGVFVCMNALALLMGRDPVEAFGDEAVADARRMIAATLAHGSATGEFDVEMPAAASAAAAAATTAS